MSRSDSAETGAKLFRNWMEAIDKIKQLEAELAKITQERDAALRCSIVYSQEKQSWHVGNPHSFEKHQAQRLFAIQQFLAGNDTPPQPINTEI